MAKRTPKNNMGRPKVEVPMSIVNAACQYNATSNQVLETLRSQGYHISYSTLCREIKHLHDMTFEDYRDKSTDQTRLKLVQKAVKMALEKDNVTMLIFCLKNMCGWKDRNDLTVNEPVKEKSATLTPEERREKIKELNVKSRMLGDD